MSVFVCGCGGAHQGSITESAVSLSTAELYQKFDAYRHEKECSRHTHAHTRTQSPSSRLVLQVISVGVCDLHHEADLPPVLQSRHSLTHTQKGRASHLNVSLRVVWCVQLSVLDANGWDDWLYLLMQNLVEFGIYATVRESRSSIHPSVAASCVSCACVC